MAEQFFRINRGLELNETSTFLTGAGAPAGVSGDTALVGVGSYYTNTTSGDLYIKTADTDSATDWKILATQTYVQNFSATGISWREPVLVVDFSTYADITAAETAANVADTVDGVTITAGDRVLFADLTTGADNVYIVSGSTGAWTFTEDVNSLTEGDTTYVTGGTSGGNTYVYNGTAWVLIDQTSTDEDGYQNSFIGKTAGNNMPDYSSNNIVVDSTSLETAIGALDAETGYQNTFTGKTAGSVTPNYTSNNFVVDATSLMAAISALDAEFGANVSNGNVILAANAVNANITALDGEVGYLDTFVGKTAGNSTPNYSSNTYVTDGTSLQTAVGALDAAVTTIAAASTLSTATNVTTDTVIDSVTATVLEWDIYIVNAGDATNVVASKVFALSNGTTVDFTRFANLRIGASISGLTYNVTVSAGVVSLHISSTTAVNVSARRLTVI